MSKINFTIDGKSCTAEPGQTVKRAADENGVYIPVLCDYKGLMPAGICRVCTVRIAGRQVSACTTPVVEGMVVESETEEIQDLRKSIIEMLFVEGNHYCPLCEKSGNCELQALAYRYQMLTPRFPLGFPRKNVDAYGNMILDRNRCVQCRRCVRGVVKKGQAVFQMTGRTGHTEIIVNEDLAAKMSEKEAREAMDLCPVGCILKKEVGYEVPIGKRKYDREPIGADIEKK